MDIALIVFVVVPILFAAAVAVRHLVRSVMDEGFPREGRTALDRAYAERLLRQSSTYPSVPDDAVSSLPDVRWHRFA